MNLDEFLSHMQPEGLRKQAGGYLARCPAHEDHAPSLSIGEGDDGRILLHCWAGCETRDIVAALGLRWSDLFPACVGGSRTRHR